MRSSCIYSDSCVYSIVQLTELRWRISASVALLLSLLLDSSAYGLQINSLAAAETSEVYTSSFTCSNRKTKNCGWFFCINESCKYGQISGDPLGCMNDGHVSLLDCHCMTYAEHDKVEVGMCIFNCMHMNHENESIADQVYQKVPNNISLLNDLVCSKFNRQGTLCGQCKNGTFPLVYSFNLTCVSCPETAANLVKYISVAFIPLTLFYFFIVLFKINIASSHLHGIGQAATMPVLSRSWVMAYENMPKYMVFCSRIVNTLHGVWNLDFFRSFDLGICLRTNALAILSLDLVVAVYPFLLMALSYMLLNLHDRNYRLLVMAWRPFRAFFGIFSKNWDIRTSLIDSFATFFFLSHVKLLNVAYDLLFPVLVYDLSSSGQTINYTRRLYYDATVTYLFSLCHTGPSCFISVCNTTSFNRLSISPIKVVVYPSYNDIHDIFLSEISSQRSRH